MNKRTLVIIAIIAVVLGTYIAVAQAVLNKNVHKSTQTVEVQKPKVNELPAVSTPVAEQPTPEASPAVITEPVKQKVQPQITQNSDGSVNIPSTPEFSICQDPYYQLDPATTGGVTVCMLKDGYIDCNNFTAVPVGQTCPPKNEQGLNQ